MIILGIDPGSRITGYGVINFSGNKAHYIDSGCIKMDLKASSAYRLKTIFEGIDYLIGIYKPEHFSIEQVFMHKNPNSALKLGQARGVSLCVAAMATLDIFEYSPTKIKQTVVGNGHATKDQINHMVCKILNLPKAPQTDAADALAIALCHAFHLPFLNIQTKAKTQAKI